MSALTPIRIGEFARRVGVSADLLRAWERRYGLLQPVRSSGGFRLYAEEDAARVTRMRTALEAGLSAAEAAQAALAPDSATGPSLAAAAVRLLAAIRSYDEATAQAVLDEVFTSFALDSALREVILPTLRQLGLGTGAGTIGIGEEHFGSNLIRGRLMSFARMWGRGGGPLALLACAPGEQHDLTLIAFGLILRTYGWRILFLGASTPLETIATATRMTHPQAVVLTSFNRELLRQHGPELGELAAEIGLLVSGPGADAATCDGLGLRRLEGDLFSAAASLAAGGRAAGVS